jgi:hypothetical protein
MPGRGHRDRNDMENIMITPRSAQRRIVIAGFFQGVGRLARPLAAIAIIAATLYAMPRREGAGFAMSVPPGASFVASGSAARLEPPILTR